MVALAVKFKRRKIYTHDGKKEACDHEECDRKFGSVERLASFVLGIRLHVLSAVTSLRI